jgi:hypothetical protein
MKAELEEKTKLAERKIADALQEFHESTGLIPTGINFEMIDVRTMEEHASGKRAVIVGTCEIRAGT